MTLRMLANLVLDRQQRRIGDLVEITDPSIITGLLESGLAEPAARSHWDARQVHASWIRNWRR